MNFLDIQKDVQDYVGDPSTTTLPLIKAEINEAVTEFMQEALWAFSIRQAEVNTTSGIANYYFPADFEKVISFTQRNDDIQLERMWINDFERLFPDPSNMSSPGRPRAYMELFNDRVLAQPSAAAIVTGVTDSTSDISTTAPKYASIYGSVAGVDRYEKITIHGTTFVSSNLSFTNVYGITLDLSCVGTAAFYEKGTNTNLLKLYPGEIERSYKKYKLHPTPDGSYTLYLTYQAGQIKMINDGDTCLIPTRYLGIVKNMVIARLLAKQGDQKFQLYKQQADEGLKKAKSDEEMLWDYTPALRLPNRAAVTQDYPFRYV